MKKKIFSIVFAILMLLSAFPLSVFASEQTTSDVSDFGYMDLSKTTIEYDFKYIFAGAYNVNNYLENKKASNFSFVTAMESRNANDEIELYFYVHNPLRRQVVIDTDVDSMSIAYYSTANSSLQNDYTKYGITLVNTYGATLENPQTTNALLLKYKLNFDGSTINKALDRYYRLADIELLYSGEFNPKNFVAGQEFKFFNDSKGYVDCTVQSLTTLEMEAYHTFYRVNTEGFNTYSDIQSVYFAVPNKMLKMYGELYSMKLTWEKFFLKPVLVVDNKDVVAGITNNTDNYVYNDTSFSVLYDQYFPYNDCVYDYYQRGFNVSKLSPYIYWDENHFMNGNENIAGYRWSDTSKLQIHPDTIAFKTDSGNPIKMCIYTDSISGYETKAVAGKTIIDILEKSYWSDYFINSMTRTSVRTFYVRSKDFSLNTYKTCGFWEKLWNGDVYEVETGEKVDVSRFQTVDLNDLKALTKEEFSKRYLIDVSDVKCDIGGCGACFACNVQKAEYKDCTWFFLRYATTDYKSYNASVINNETGIADVCNAFVFEMEGIKAFDTISIGFSTTDENGNKTISVFPIGRSPTNFASDAWTPSKVPKVDLSILDGMRDWYETIEKILIIILCVLAFIIVVKLITFFKRMFDKKSRKKDKKDE